MCLKILSHLDLKNILQIRYCLPFPVTNEETDHERLNYFLNVTQLAKLQSEFETRSVQILSTKSDKPLLFINMQTAVYVNTII